MAAPIASEYRGHTDNLPSGWRVDLQAVADVNPDMGDTRFIGVGKEHQVGRMGVTDRNSRIKLIDRNSR